jgi:hypothetical protein
MMITELIGMNQSAGWVLGSTLTLKTGIKKFSFYRNAS